MLIDVLCKPTFAQWNDVGGGVNAWGVHTFFEDTSSGLLYVGGIFDQAGGVNRNCIATWDGTNWATFGSNNVPSSPRGIYAIEKYNGNIIIAGEFDSIGNIRVNNIAQWNGATWEPVGGGFNSGVGDLIVYNGDLYACGSFTYSDTINVQCFARWDGIKWVMAAELIGYAYSMEIHNSKLVIGGAFTTQTFPSKVGIAAWDGINIDTTYGSFNGAVLKLRNINDTLYAVGSFTGFWANPSDYISVYYNQTWHSIGSPTGGQNDVLDAIRYNNELYFCGLFTNPPDLCIYNGGSFDSVFDMTGYVRTMIEYQNELYVGGLFTSINGVTIGGIAKYNGLGNSIFSVKSPEQLIVFPNPSVNGEFNLKSNGRKIQNIQVVNSNGHIVFDKDFSEHEKHEGHFAFSAFQGIYYLKCRFADGSLFTRKLIIV